MAVYITWGEFVKMVEDAGVHEDTEIHSLLAESLWSDHVCSYVSHTVLDDVSSVDINLSKKEADDE